MECVLYPLKMTENPTGVFIWCVYMHSSDYRLNNQHGNIQIDGANRQGNNGNSERLYFGGLQNHCGWWLQAQNFKKMFAPWKKSYDKPRQSNRKQRHHFANKGLCNQSCGFSRSHVWMWELHRKEGWVPKNWCFWTVVLEKTLWESLGLQGDPTSQS